MQKTSSSICQPSETIRSFDCCQQTSSSQDLSNPKPGHNTRGSGRGGARWDGAVGRGRARQLSPMPWKPWGARGTVVPLANRPVGGPSCSTPPLPSISPCAAPPPKPARRIPGFLTRQVSYVASPGTFCGKQTNIHLRVALAESKTWPPQSQEFDRPMTTQISRPAPKPLKTGVLHVYMRTNIIQAEP